MQQFLKCLSMNNSTCHKRTLNVLFIITCNSVPDLSSNVFNVFTLYLSHIPRIVYFSLCVSLSLSPESLSITMYLLFQSSFFSLFSLVFIITTSLKFILAFFNLLLCFLRLYVFIIYSLSIYLFFYLSLFFVSLPI